MIPMLKKKLHPILFTVLTVAIGTQVAIADSYAEWSEDYESIYRGYSCGDARLFDEPENYIFIMVFEEAFDEDANVRPALVKINDREYIGGAHQEGLDYRVDFGFEESENKHFAIVIQNDGSAGFYDFDSKEAKDNDGYARPARQLECILHEDTKQQSLIPSGFDEEDFSNRDSGGGNGARLSSDLSDLDRDTRQSIELACITEKGQGPAPHRRCVEQQLKSIGIEVD